MLLRTRALPRAGHELGCCSFLPGLPMWRVFRRISLAWGVLQQQHHTKAPELGSRGRRAGLVVLCC